MHCYEVVYLYLFKYSGEQVKKNEMGGAGHVARMGARRGAYRVLVRKPEGKRPLGRPRLVWEGNIKVDL